MNFSHNEKRERRSNNKFSGLLLQAPITRGVKKNQFRTTRSKNPLNRSEISDIRYFYDFGYFGPNIKKIGFLDRMQFGIFQKLSTGRFEDPVTRSENFGSDSNHNSSDPISDIEQPYILPVG